MDETLEREILERLDGDGAPDDDVATLVYAACLGDGELEQALGGQAAPRRAVTAGEAPGAAHAYLRSVTVEGFRGVGPRATLTVEPGPGLTLVVGRNGSGKSTFAEGLELLLTGTSHRWEARSQQWKEGWRNLHHHGPRKIEATFAIEGRERATKVSRVWDADADLADTTTTVQHAGEPAAELSTLGWSDAVVTYRPFLSYNELGALLEDGPSKLYDRLAPILGLDDLVAADTRLQGAHKERDALVKGAKAQAKLLAGQCDDLADDRARRAVVHLLARMPDLDALEALATGTGEGGGDGVRGVLRALAALSSPSLDEVASAVAELRAAHDGLLAVAGTDADRARELADLLDRAVAFHEHHGDGDCPVCGRAGALDADWRSATAQAIGELRAEATNAIAARTRHAAARQAAAALLDRPPDVLSHPVAGIDTGPLADAWQTWAALADDAAVPLDTLAGAIEEHAPGLVDEIEAVRQEADAAMARLDSEWAPLAARLAAWVQQARAAERARPHLSTLKKARDWLKQAADEIRAARFQPIAAQVREHWKLLSLNSNVDIDDIVLSGTGVKRRVEVAVKVDDVDGAALAVMSQGELHALALSLFLPRATLPSSPFGFVVIDDPVQAMDPAKVDGLADALSRVAETRQVVVFTHDERLPDAVRRLGLPARIVEVTRRPGSVVELVESKDPAQRALDDAFAIVKSEDLPESIRARVVPGLCRTAIEAACADVVRRRRLDRGERHADVERLLLAQHKLGTWLALALFDDDGRAGEVMGRLNAWGRSFGDTFAGVNRGAHTGFDGDLTQLARGAEALVGKLRALS